MKNIVFLLSAILILASCSSSRVNIYARGTQVNAKDGFGLIAYELADNKNLKIIDEPRSVFFYIQGSEYETVTTKLSFMASAVIFKARAIMMEKRGCYHNSVDTTLAIRYDDKQTRVNDHLAVIEHFIQQIPANVPVILVGASEGGDIAAEVAEKCKRINYLILIGSGGGWSQKTEFQYFVSRYPGYLNCATVAELNQKIATIETSNNDSLQWAGHPYRRWKTYLNDSILIHLKNLDIPILLFHGSEDVNVPVQSARELDYAFKALHKTNLTYKEYKDVDHRFYNVNNNKNYFPHLEIDMIKWFSEHQLVTDFEANIFTKRVKKSHKDIF